MATDEKLRNEQGEIAVLYSPQYGAGWFSWNEGVPDCLFDGDVARAVQAGDVAKAQEIAEAKWPDGYWGGARDLKIEWMRPGQVFRIDEYDGRESIQWGPYDYNVVPA